MPKRSLNRCWLNTFYSHSAYIALARLFFTVWPTILSQKTIIKPAMSTSFLTQRRKIWLITIVRTALNCLRASYDNISTKYLSVFFCLVFVLGFHTRRRVLITPLRYKIRALDPFALLYCRAVADSWCDRFRGVRRARSGVSVRARVNVHDRLTMNKYYNLCAFRARSRSRRTYIVIYYYNGYGDVWYVCAYASPSTPSKPEKYVTSKNAFTHGWCAPQSLLASATVV